MRTLITIGVALGFIAFILVASYCVLGLVIRALDISIERDIKKRMSHRVRRPCFICKGTGRRAKLSSAPCSWCVGKGFIFINESQPGKES